MYQIASKGERKIKQILEKNDVNYFYEYRFNDCRNELPLPFDFYLPDFKTCIEYDGIQHFEIIEHFGGENSFIERRLKDEIKNKYCKDKKINLIRISHNNYDNIEKIIKNELLY